MKEDRTRESTSIESTVDPLPDPTKKSARRRFLVSGSKLAPVVAATLASRPSLACHCVMPSAWGSINLAANGVPQDMPEGAATLTGSMARYNASSIAFTPYYISGFAANGAGWAALAAKLQTVKLSPSPSTLSSLSSTDQVKYLQGNYSTAAIDTLTVSRLCKKINFSSTPIAGDNSGKPIDTTTGGGFRASFLVAELNVFLGKIPNGCLSAAVLGAMADGAYQPSGGGQAWVPADIADYLHNNWIARRA